jgi:hypothetical protein
MSVAVRSPVRRVRVRWVSKVEAFQAWWGIGLAGCDQWTGGGQDTFHLVESRASFSLMVACGGGVGRAVTACFEGVSGPL